MLMPTRKNLMENKYIKKTSIPGVLILERPTFDDERGFFRETFRKSELEEVLGKPWVPAQENHSRSKKKVLRGIHVAPWSKLIYVPRGEVYEVVVDLRKNSPTFKKWISINLGESNRVKLFVPAHCGNAFYILSDKADYTYQVDQEWETGQEKEIKWNDPDIAIKWPDQNPIISDRDKNASLLKEFLQLQ